MMMLLCFFLTVIGQTVLGAPAVNHDSRPKLACDKVTIPQLDGLTVTSAQSVEVHNYTLPSNPSGTQASFCNYTLTLNHDGANDVVFVSIWLPLDNWNGRFLATGGGGLAAGTFASALTDPVSKGYAAGSTDAGLTLNHTIDPNSGEWALNPDRSINTALIENFATRSIHEMTLIGKAAVKSFYGTDPQHSYYSGCSQGGRQGYFAAQYSPEDFDGILANAPAINTPQVSPGDFWPSVVMGNIAAPPQCIFQTYQAAIIAECDPLDGAADGLISAPEKCNFDTSKLVGKEINCTDTSGGVSITEAYAEVVAKTLEGATTTSGEFLWYGNPPGAPFSGLANTKTENGVTVPVPFAPAEAWMRYFVAQNPDLDTASLTFAEFEDIFQQSVDKYIEPFGTDAPDLTAFKKAGGKLLTWHGMADPLIAHPGTTLYWDRLQKKMGGTEGLNEFYRVFLAPGAGHCGGGYGPVPVDPLSVLVGWVEQGKVPDTMFATTTQDGVDTTRNLCPYPQSLRYKGEGDLEDAASFVCEK
ncbi:putative feruloyl esterase [Colletotrichum fructicola]|uniref:Carboxylic ester hydrolase n=1 Tax=Colletotrichum fructicola (strain Nara gc5) TaxID=1213859 RepID=L2FPC0_COLFN|nr:putative feruloyl esterase [Colletotrichum fructicola]KAF4479092.1 putative feruloyl esterase [Colletotrichum fructicola Nara gc5]KAF4893876.1 putative feruloyl esterase [Colletotrichum fructicola]KAF4910540.1 putative feruloyl esterase [Colletotrichum fructicola]KAF4939041.1 putative feruloyl esterase [Colletotrichum fructicola]